MHAYFVDGGTYKVTVGMAGGYPETETDRALALVFAETREKAKLLFLRWFSKRADFDWTTPVRIVLVRKDVARSEGLAAANDELWGDVPWEKFDAS